MFKRRVLVLICGMPNSFANNLDNKNHNKMFHRHCFFIKIVWLYFHCAILEFKQSENLKTFIFQIAVARSVRWKREICFFLLKEERRNLLFSHQHFFFFPFFSQFFVFRSLIHVYLYEFNIIHRKIFNLLAKYVSRGSFEWMELWTGERTILNVH